MTRGHGMSAFRKATLRRLVATILLAAVPYGTMGCHSGDDATEAQKTHVGMSANDIEKKQDAMQEGTGSTPTPPPNGGATTH